MSKPGSRKLETEPSNKKPNLTSSVNLELASPSQNEPNSNHCNENVIASEQAAGDSITGTVRTFGSMMCMLSEKLITMDSLLRESSFNGKWDYNWDGMDCVRTKSSRHIYFIRHGQYNMNGVNDDAKCLTNRGIEQARLTGERLRAMGIKFKSLTSSNMSRALETSSLILRALEDFDIMFKTDSILREGLPCLPEPFELSNKCQKRCGPEGERIEDAFKKYFHRAEEAQKKDTHEIIVCHANVIRYFTCRAMQVQPDAWLRIDLGHASITQFEINRNGVAILYGVNGISHFAQSLISFS